MRLLLVEDDDLNVELFLDIVEAAGDTTVVERDGLHGRERALTEPFDVIVLDIGLPDIPGDDICRALRTEGITTPIIALSADALPAQIESRMQAGFDRYLTKPVSPGTLRAALLAAKDAHR